MEQPHEVERYIATMEEIKVRLAFVGTLMGTDGPAAIHIGAIESAYLQLRKILELVAFASLTANKHAFSKIYAKFSKIWHAGQLLRDLKKVNQHFYPIPLIQTPSTEPGVKWHMEERPSDYLDQTAFLLLYTRIGELMHARNPYAKPILYDEYHEEIGDWCAKVRNLLEFHGIVLAENPNRWLVRMVEADGRVHVYPASPTTRKAK